MRHFRPFRPFSVTRVPKCMLGPNFHPNFGSGGRLGLGFKVRVEGLGFRV